MNIFIFIFLFLSLASISNQKSTSLGTKQGGHGFSVELIHSHSPQSPMYNPNVTDFDLWVSINNYQSDIHIKYFKTKTKRNLTSSSLKPTITMRSPVSYVGYQYLIMFSIGTPQVQVHAIFDTGSKLLWLQCLPCSKCYNQKDPLLDPSKSSSYSLLPCDSAICGKIPGSGCSAWHDICEYNIWYADGSVSTGDIAEDDITFLTTETDPGTFKMPNTVFGCGHYNRGSFNEASQGVLGMSMGPYSLLSQMSGWIKGRFSYCLVDNTNPFSTSQMLFGDKAILIGNSTPLAVPTGKVEWYYLSLLDISVGTIKLNIPPGTFQRDAHGEGGLILDTGTPLTRLERTGYEILEKKVRKMADLKVAPIQSLSTLCFFGSKSDLDAGKLPSLTFHFQGLDLYLSPYSVYQVLGNRYICMAALPSDSFSIFGSLFQRNLNIGFDLYQNRIFMYETNCNN
ncbi:Aspartic peptidase A1 family protein [Dioscorea alata]|uniref:Aspartic peptidase A1 family protein n=1 Tax=Dioscorea alata TaxID=55571 RepID=A0ACB7WQ85_DIOAL|nr:Aspartic peptidase A1 family protein [Dioscorea alata]